MAERATSGRGRGWRSDRRVSEVLREADLAHVAVAARSGPHVTPAVFDLDGDRLWFLTPRRRSLKARVIARRRRVGALVQSGSRAVLIAGRARIVDPLTARGVFSPGPLLDLPLAAAGYLGRNRRHAAGTVRDHPAPTLALSRVMVSIDIGRLALLDGWTVVDAWGPWPASDLLLAGDPPPGRIPDLGSVPPRIRDLLGPGGPVVLGWPSVSGPLALPARWRSGPGGVETSAEAMVLAGAGSAGPACLTVERSRHRLESKQGLLLTGEGQARRAGPGAHVSLAAGRATWWTGEDRRTIPAPTG